MNLDVGHILNGGDPIQIRLFGGLQFARITQDVTANFRSFDDQTTSSNTTESSFNGVGPRLGMDGRCAWGNFDFLGEIGGSALVGGLKSRLDFTATSPSLAGLGITPPNTQSLTSPNSTQVVPCLDCKLGSGYTLPVGRCGIIRVEAGYQAAVYINAESEYSISEVVTPPTAQSVGVFLRTAEHQQSTVEVHGPYFTASWVY